jgi:pyruvate kinase
MTQPQTIRRRRQTKVVATLGPASSDPQRIRELFVAGVDVFRLNFSHGTHADHDRTLQAIRSVEREVGRPIAILADLQGPKLRIGRFEAGPIRLQPGQELRLELGEEGGSAERVPVPHPEIFQVTRPGHALVLDDGNVRLRVGDCGPDYAVATVEAGHRLSDRKGLNVPDAMLPVSSLTRKDYDDLRFVLERSVDWIALSFVQRPEDVAEARRLIAGRAQVVVKMEKPLAIQHLDELIEMADAMMVARGDLGVEMPAEDVPTLQKRIVRHCRRAGKPVIVATQMLESMIAAPTPTRAEASDVATAVFDGADAVMLSAETAVGQYPAEAVAMMDRIARRVERDPMYRAFIESWRHEPENTAADAITAAARQVAHTISASAIVTFTSSGSTTMRAARERPEVPILCLTPHIGTARRLALCWGVHAVRVAEVRSFSEMVDRACTVAFTEGFAQEGQRLVITAGVPFGTPGNTNILRIAWVGA